jgi:WD40 repeat protein
MSERLADTSISQGAFAPQTLRYSAIAAKRGTLIAQQPVETKSWQNIRLVCTLPEKELGTFAISPNGQAFATATRRTTVVSSPLGTAITPTKDNIIKLWNLSTGELIRTITYYSPADIRSVTFSPDGRILATSAYSEQKVLTIKLWDLKTGQELQTMRSFVEPKVTNYPGGASSTSIAANIAFSPDGQTLTSMTAGSSSIQIWEVKPYSRSSKNIDQKMARVWGLGAREAREKTSLVGGHKRQYLDIAPVQTNTKNQSAVSGTKVSAKTEQARTELFVTARTVLEELGTDTADRTRTFTGQGYIISSQDNDFTVATDEGRRVLFQMRDGQFDRSIDLSATDIANFRGAVQKLLNQGALRHTLTAHTDEVAAVAFSQDGQILISGSADKTIKLWNLKTGQLIRTLTGHTQAINTLVVSPDGQFLASGGSTDKTIKLWNLTTGSLTRTFVDGGQVGTVRFSPDGKNLIAVSLVPNSVDGRIQVWQVGTGKLIHRIPNITWRAGISISPDGKNYAIAGNGMTAQVLDLMTDKTITSFNEEGRILFTPDGKSLLIASAQGIQVWQ